MRKILLIDDDPDIYDVLKIMLQPEGFQLLWAQNISLFEKMAFDEKPALMILDIMLGEDNGPAFYGHLIAKGLDRNIPVIFLSCLAADIASSRPQAGRNYAMHAKPFQYDDLLRDIRTLTDAA